ncbi:restriction endonuclease subunit S [Pseudomonas aeruginosa]|uniref:restriction endonuclease subunit S n=1 Tax=Pseudomonas aeruginosa TaxID=287 RepID=UPI0028BC3053|nr:restriction endonuclease subunit S [Pseudomonas aeruginosa]ELN4221263.1 restriction endonuclease subunit S [Pseudomonas aeruginosa]ELV3705123.1 restriction endonuclease subunit S [Pseudomonas aeruginosa]ELX9567680.1 restriction endonuclease subunit S [Pseudomonas aeruginosa]EMF0961127.1 restriction endonuclease subunit S [Pseudomonas aeruginosa]
MSWPLVQIGKYADKVRTWNPAAGAECVFQYVDLSSVDKSRKIIDLDNVAEISSAEAPSRARQLVVAGDVLVATVRPNLNGVAVVPAELNGATASTGYCVLRADEKNLHGRYLFHWVQTGSFVEDMMSKATGANYPAVSDKIVKESKIPLPPLPEQKRIAAILDKADAIRRKRQQAIQLADDFLRAVFLDMFGDPVTNPKGWGTACLEELVKVVSGATPSKSNDAYWTGDFPWVSPKDMKSVEISSSIDHINQVVFERENLKKLPVGSVLIVVRGMILAHTVPVGITTAEVAINQDIKAFVSSGRVLPEFLLWFLLSQHANLLSKVTTAAHGTKRFDMVDLINLPVFVPDMVAQRKFVSIAKSYKTTLAELDWCHKDALQLFNSLSQRAFASQL